MAYIRTTVPALMNVFIVPSWYPSDQNPIYGTFVQEQIHGLAKENPKDNFSISIWGQGDPSYLLWAGKPFSSIRKVIQKPQQRQCFNGENLQEFFSPAFTWTRKIQKGNINGIIKANEANFAASTFRYGVPDIIHCQASYPAALVGQYLSEKFQIPYIVTIRMSPFPFSEFLDPNGNLVEFVNRPLQQAACLVATSSSLAQQLQSFGFKQVKVIHNPVDTSLFLLKKKSLSENQIRLIAIGRLVEQKGFDILINAISKLPDNFYLTIVGEGEDRPKLESLIRKLQLERRVILAGEKSRSEVAELLPQYDRYVLSSRHETFGNVLLEAMACGLPVVATDCGGPADIVVSKVGKLVPINDANKLVAALLEVNEIKYDPNEIRQYVIENFSLSKFSIATRALYREVLEKNV